MYLAQCLRQELDYYNQRGWVLVVFRVALNDAGCPVWRRHADHGVYTAQHYIAPRSRARRTRRKDIPLLPSDLAFGKLVTPSQAVRLTGHTLKAAALDYLTESLHDGYGDSPGLSNYTKPPRVKAKKEPPTAVETATTEAARCAAKVAEYESKAARIETLRKKWARRAAYYTRRAASLEITGESK